MSDEEEELDGGTVAELPPAAEDEEEELDGGQLGPSQEEEEEELDGGELGEPVDDLFTDQDPFYAAATAQPPWEPHGTMGRNHRGAEEVAKHHMRLVTSQKRRSSLNKQTHKQDTQTSHSSSMARV